MDIKRIHFALKGIGLSGIIRTLYHTVLSEFTNKRYKSTTDKKPLILPGNIKRHTTLNGGLELEFENAAVEIVCLSEFIIRISWKPGEEPIPYTLKKRKWKFHQPNIKENASGYSLECGEIIIFINKLGCINFQDKNQNILKADDSPIQKDNGWELTATLKPDEHIYGLGERAHSLNLRPGTYTSWNIDVGGSYTTGADPLYIGTPIYLSLSALGCYLIYFEDSYRSKHVIDKNITSLFDGGMLRYYFIYGSLTTIFENLSKLLGQPCMPPRWVLGYHHSRWGYRNEKDIREVVKGFVEHQLPLSAIHLDIDYMDGYRVFSIDKSRFPNMSQLTSELDNKGIKLVAIINPGVKVDKNFSLFLEGKQDQLFCTSPDHRIMKGVSWPGWFAYPDFANSKARSWWQKQYKLLLDQGIAGFWHDMNEPASFSAWGDLTLPLFTHHNKDGASGDHREIHNVYGLLMNEAAYSGLRELKPDKRPWLFSRSGWAGLQRYAWNWTGDVDSSWQSLKQTIVTILGLGLSGHAFSGGDIGGFSGNPDAELFVRWFQMSTFFPLFRTHSSVGTKPREPWCFEESILNIVRKFLALRYKLQPYLYTVIWDSSQTGIPPLRPLFWNEPDEPTFWDIDDEFFLGDDMLIAPVLTQGALKRKIILPRGIWYSFWDDKQYVGPQQFDIELSLNTIPIFIKAGSILPLDDSDGISLHVYPHYDKTSISHMYYDEGDGYGAFRVENFVMKQDTNMLSISWNSEGDYPSIFTTIKVTIHSERIIEQASADGIPLPINGKSISTPGFQNLCIWFM